MYSFVEHTWREIYAYNSNEEDGNIFELLNDSEYRDKSVVDVDLKKDGLEISVEDGYAEEGTWYSKGYRIIVN